MSTPFDTPAPEPIVPATDGQLRYIRSMWAERDRTGQPEKYISRAAAVNMAIGIATDDAKIIKFGMELVVSSPVYGERVNQLLEYTGNDLTEPEDVYMWAPVTRKSASTMIDWLTTLPRKDRVELVRAALPETGATYSSEMPSDAVVPAGRYAVKTEDGAINGLAFYKIDRPTEGRWAGYVFVKHIVGGDEHRVSFAASKSILAKIAAVGAAEASATYGHEIGECGVCGRQLTNDESRARGIGPKCAANQGW